MSLSENHVDVGAGFGTRGDPRNLPAADARRSSSHHHAAVSAWPNHILVSTNGSASSNAAVIAARHLASRSGASVETLGVYSPRIAVPLPVQSPLARELGADVVVLGIGAREPADRPLYAGRRSAGLPEYLGVPVLAVAAGCEAATRCVVAFPDGRVRHRVVCAALACMPHGSRMWIALPISASHDGAEQETFRLDGVGMRSPRAAEALPEIQIRRVDMSADRCDVVLGLATELDADLIAVSEPRLAGVEHGYDLAESLLLSARCSVLVVPDRRDD
jgi:nucleotide-binding universal stress UspA family protein